MQSETYTLTPEEEAYINRQETDGDDVGYDPRREWLLAPTDLHYKGELVELGVRATDLMELETIRNETLTMISSLRFTAVHGNEPPLEEFGGWIMSDWSPGEGNEDGYLNNPDPATEAELDALAYWEGFNPPCPGCGSTDVCADDCSYMAYLEDCEKEAKRGKLAGAPHEMECYTCAREDTEGALKDQYQTDQYGYTYIMRKVVDIGPILEARRDPTSSYKLECDHIAF